MDTYAIETMYEFVEGKLSIEDEWDSFIATLKSGAYGDIQEMLDIYNSKL